MDMQEFEERGRAIKALIAFQKIQGGEIQTELLNEDDFKEILDGRDLVLNYSFYFDGEQNSFAKSPPSPEKVEKVNYIFDRLEDIYNRRFKPEKLSNKNLEKIERLYLFQKLGLFDAPILQGNTITNVNKQKILSLILDINERDIKGAMNRLSKSSRDSKGQLDPDAQKRMDELFNSITKLQV